MDIWNKEKRSAVMQKIRGKNTKPELLLRSALHRNGFRFRIHVNKLPGKPDIVLRKYKTVIFVNGCFWHQHNECHEGRIPSSNEEYWIEKFRKVKIKDEENEVKLIKMGWKVQIVWECEIEKIFDEKFKEIIRNLET